MAPSGEQFHLESHGYAADVASVGAALRTLTHEGRPLVRGWDAASLMPVYSGAVLAPWPNRIGDGRYDFEGSSYEVPLNEHERRTALHGLVAWAAWEPVEVTDCSVVLATRVHPSLAYPGRLDLEARCSLGADGLSWSVTARNVGDATAPYGSSVHPYFTAVGAGSVDGWTFELAAESYLEVDPERMLPVSLEPTAGTPFDFAVPRVVGDVFIDHAFTGLAFDEADSTTARLLDASGNGVALSWDRTCPWVQVHTADRPEPELHRTGLAIEPMTCPPDAFRTGQDVVVLAPGDEHTASWRISAVTG